MLLSALISVGLPQVAPAPLVPLAVMVPGVTPVTAFSARSVMRTLTDVPPVTSVPLALMLLLRVPPALGAW